MPISAKTASVPTLPHLPALPCVADLAALALPPSLTSQAPHSRLLAAVPRALIRQKAFTRQDIPALRGYRDEALRLLVPAGEEAVITAVGRLSLHYPQPSMDAEASASRWDDWCEDFAAIPPDLLHAACAAWRRSQARFAPTPGQLLALCTGVKIRRSQANRAADVIALLETAE